MSSIYFSLANRHKIRLDPTNGIDKHILEKGAWENHITEFLLFWIKPGSTCIDVGANAGYHTLVMAGQTGTHGTVHAFEPNDVIIPRLIENIDLNPELRDIIKLHKIALSNSPGELKIFQSGQDIGNAYISAEYKEKYWNYGSSQDYQICQVARLDDLIGEQKVDLIKADVEGMELEVFEGAINILKRDQPTLIFETLVETFDKDKIKHLQDLLNSLDYFLCALNPQLRKYIPVTFPYFYEDTYAIHKSKLINAAEILLNAAKFIPQDQSLSPSVKELIIAYDYAHNLYVKIINLDNTEMVWDRLNFSPHDIKVDLRLKNTQDVMALQFHSPEPKEAVLTINNLQIPLVCSGGQLALY